MVPDQVHLWARESVKVYSLHHGGQLRVKGSIPEPPKRCHHRHVVQLLTEGVGGYY